MLISNAWHARSDAASSLVVAIGIVGNLLGYTFADSVAAVIVGFMIVRMGTVFAWEAVQELIDTGLSIDEVNSIRQVIVDTPGVSSLHELRTRRMAHRSLVDAHVCVEPRVSVSEGHRIAEMTRERVLESHSAVADVLVHVDVEDDLDHDLASHGLPDRDELVKHLAPAFVGLPAPEQVVLHYLGGRVEVEILLAAGMSTDSVVLARLEADVAAVLADLPQVGSLSLNQRLRTFVGSR